MAKQARQSVPETSPVLVAPVAMVGDSKAKGDVKAILGEISKLAAGRDLADRDAKGRTVASKVAKGMNSSPYPCPTGGRMHPGRPGFAFWTGIDLSGFVTKHGS